MQAPIIQKVIFSKKVFVERRPPDLPVGKAGAGKAKFLVKKGSKVRPFDFVAEIKDTVRQRLTAGVGGEVVKILPDKAVLIRTEAVIIRGVVGSGEDSEGEVRIAADYNEPIKLEAIDAGCLGQILVGGNVPTLEVFKKAEAVGVKGVVCGGADFSAFAKTKLPTLITEGFGKPPLNRKIFDFLKNVEGRHVFLSPDHEELLVAHYADGEEGRYELLDAQSEEVTEVFADLKKGMEVQVFTSSTFGQTGKIEKVGEKIEVLLDGGEKIEVPARNLGIIK